MNISEEEKQLLAFISVYDIKIQDIGVYLRSFVLENHPDANQLIYDGYNAVSIAFSLSDKLEDAFCHIALYKNHVNFGLNRRAEIKDPDLKLEGGGKLIRHYKVKDIDNIPLAQLATLLNKAEKISYAANPSLTDQRPKSQLFIKSISGKKVRP